MVEYQTLTESRKCALGMLQPTIQKYELCRKSYWLSIASSYFIRDTLSGCQCARTQARTLLPLPFPSSPRKLNNHRPKLGLQPFFETARQGLLVICPVCIADCQTLRIMQVWQPLANLGSQHR